MPKYRVVEKSIINHRPVEPGEIVEYTGEASPNLELIPEPPAPTPPPQRGLFEMLFAAIGWRA